jgi:hypothetical protein
MLLAMSEDSLEILKQFRVLLFNTFSMVNPETSVPYLGTMGMEREKPYKCEFERSQISLSTL